MAGFFREYQPEISVNNNCTSLEFNLAQCSAEESSCDQCRLLEDHIKGQNAELHRRQRNHDEMRALVDWLKRDVSKAEARIHELVKGTVREGGKYDTSQQTDKNDGEGEDEKLKHNAPPVNQEQMKDAKIESLQKKLSERNEKLSQLEEKLDDYETKIERLQRLQQSYFEEIQKLSSTVRQRTKDLRINKEIETEREEKIRRLVVDNELLNYMICRQERHRGGDIPGEENLESHAP